MAVQVYADSDTAVPFGLLNLNTPMYSHII
eukprot:SAG31_NODE_2251_length_6082_cov_2.050643_9_plen_30_part_00